MLQICTLASATRRALMPREVSKFAQNRQLRVYALRDGSSSPCLSAEVKDWLDGDDRGVEAMGVGDLGKLVIENLFSGSSSVSDSLSLESLEMNIRGDEMLRREGVADLTSGVIGPLDADVTLGCNDSMRCLR